jgi:L,D-peptidoglycan transpeptidase YkuD (ErfK/YbiS/YcfS/YnhG family)
MPTRISYKLFTLITIAGALVISWALYQGANEDLCQHLTTVTIPSSTQQVIFVQSQQGVKAKITACEWNKQWHTALFTRPIAAVIGKNGLAALGTKKEGDLKTPEGLYPIEWTFGTTPLALKMDFRYITDEDKFIDDPKNKDYNTWIHGTTSAQSYEPMRIPLYKLGAVVNYNMNPIMSGAGSAIFLHLWRSADQGTAGCIAMSEEHLLSLLLWLDKKQHPYIYISDKHFKE